MRQFILILVIVCATKVSAQVDVYSCDASSTAVSQQRIDQEDSIYNNCLTIGNVGSVVVGGTVQKSIKARKKIHLMSGTHLGGFSGNGSVHLYLDKDTSELATAVMNYPNLLSVLRYKKLEFGIKLPADLKKRINHFLFQEGIHQDELNPFVAWDVDVEACFEHIYPTNEGWWECVPGFYTRNYKVDSSIHDWVDLGTDYPFRVRFAPPKNGKWRCTIFIKINGQTAYFGKPFIFNVIESGNPGYVKVAPNHMNLARNGKLIFPVGQNFPSPGDAGCGGNQNLIEEHSERCTSPEVWNQYLEMVKTYFDGANQVADPNKPKFIRFVAMPWSGLIEYEEKGNYYKRLHIAWELDSLIDLCEAYDGLMIFDVMYQAPLMYRYYAWQWCWEHMDEDGNYMTSSWVNKRPHYCYNDDPGPGGKRPDEMFTNAIDLAYHKQRMRYYIARWGYSTQIYEWELLSEPWHLDAYDPVGQGTAATVEPYSMHTNPNYQEAHQAVLNYEKVISNYIKDSLKHTKQLVGVDIFFGGKENTVAEKMANEKAILLKNVDIVGINPYYTAPNSLYVSNDNSMYKNIIEIQKYQTNHGKVKTPIIIPEGGTDNVYNLCSNYAMRPVDAMTLGFTGVAGFHFWDGNAPNANGSFPTNLWQPIYHAQKFMNSSAIINTLSQGGWAWEHGMQKEKLKDNDFDDVEAVAMQYFVSDNKKISVGYVRNRTDNVYTNRASDTALCAYTKYNNDDLVAEESPVNAKLNIKWDDVKLSHKIKITELKHFKKYRIDFYGYQNGAVQYISTDYKTTTLAGKLKLRYPELRVEETWQHRPVVWFVVRRKGYSIMEPYNYDGYVEEIPMIFHIDTTSSFLGIGKETEFKHPQVYPNPFGGQLTIESSKEDEIIIQSVSGRSIIMKAIKSGKTKISTYGLAKGLYLIHFIKQNEFFKIIKR